MKTEEAEITQEVLQLLKPEQAWHYLAVPKSITGKTVDLYISKNNSSEDVRNELEMILNKSVTLLPVEEATVQKMLSKHFRKANNSGLETTQKIFNLKSTDFLKTLVAEAKNLGSSDIHVETYEEKCRVRLRIDGNLIERMIIDKSDYPSLINMIKIQANLDIAEKRLPQDGRIFFQDGVAKFDIRVSSLPTLYGEKIVLRLLSSDATGVDINELGFKKSELQSYLEGIKKPHGIVLISGPTGSGKTTTLYATLKVLNKEKTNIVTIEDPVEYTLKGINQVQVKESIGLTFASALRTFLRQDPDVIMLGEIRDGETAQMAIRAALTGHLVLSTIHTNSAWGTVSRLIDMGIPPFLLANTLNTSVAQRLVRLLCPDCKQEESFDSTLLPRHFTPPNMPAKHCVPKGCQYCHYTGYKGRKAIYEIISIDSQLSEYIKENKLKIDDQLKSRGIQSLSDNAFALFNNRETSLEEVYSLFSNEF